MWRNRLRSCLQRIRLCMWRIDLRFTARKCTRSLKWRKWKKKIILCVWERIPSTWILWKHSETGIHLTIARDSNNFWRFKAVWLQAAYKDVERQKDRSGEERWCSRTQTRWRPRNSYGLPPTST
jgi:hypothetical protein